MSPTKTPARPDAGPSPQRGITSLFQRGQARIIVFLQKHSYKRATAIAVSWLYCSKNIHCSTRARWNVSSGTNDVPSRDTRGSHSTRPRTCSVNRQHRHLAVRFIARNDGVRVSPSTYRSRAIGTAHAVLKHHLDLVAVAGRRHSVNNVAHETPFCEGKLKRTGVATARIEANFVRNGAPSRVPSAQVLSA